MTAWDLKDSIDIFSDADQIILLHRKSLAIDDDGAAAAAAGSDTDNMSPETLVRVAKARHRAERECVLHFEGAQHRFRELDDVGTAPITGSVHQEQSLQDWANWVVGVGIDGYP